MLSMLFSIPRPAAGPQFDRSRSLPKLCLALLFASLLLAPPASADGSTDPIYRTPPQELVDMIDAPLSPWVLVTPDERQLLIMDWTMLSDIEELSEPELKLAGRRIKPRNNGPSRTRPFTGMRLQSLEDKAVRPVTGLPAKLRFTNVRFAPGGRHASFTRTVAEGIELWVLDLESASARRLTEPVVSLTADEAPEWLDAETLVLALVPEDRGLPPQKEAVPRGPVIQENLGQKAPARTFQDLLGNTHDEALFDFYFSSQLARVDLGGKITKLGDPAVFWGIDPSPDGRYVLVDILHRPYSYLVPIWRFPMRTEIWTRDGAPMRQIYDRPLQENIPIARGSVATGPRDVSWRSDAPATAAWVEALDGGDAGAEAEVRDKLMTLAAPFRGEAQEIARFGLRFGGIQWGRDDLAIAGEWWWPTRKLRTWRVFPGEPGRDPVLMQDRSWEDRYSDPGDTVTKVNAWGREVLDTGADGDVLFRIGDGASPEGDRPFLDRYDLETGEVERLFRSEAPYYEEPMEVLDDGGRYVLTRRESVDEVPDYYVRDLKKDRITRVTEFPHPTPLLQGMHKELVKYQRSDGVDLNATLYLPPGHDPEKDDPLPMVMWAYPREFKSAAAAGQIDDSPYRFTRIGWWSPVIWVTQGYAVLDDPKMPIIGEGDSEPNDRFREQLVSSASAAVDEVVRRGVTRRDTIAIGGHSYGAFMAANLLAHSDLFAAGIAQSGAYNRTLTPFGFQAEGRTLWEAPETYFTMSPFMHAEKVNEPILLVHGQVDNNPGTYPVQSERFYTALKGHGANARLVMLPFESHGYQARESVLHVLWEMHRWMETHVVPEAVAPEVELATGAAD